MVNNAFLIVPVEAFKPDEDWTSLSRAGRLERMRQRQEGLTAAITDRLRDMDVDYLEGGGGWTVSSSKPAKRQDIARKLEGLPVSVAPNVRFHTM